jgi:hypothetical protein
MPFVVLPVLFTSITVHSRRRLSTETVDDAALDGPVGGRRGCQPKRDTRAVEVEWEEKSHPGTCVEGMSRLRTWRRAPPLMQEHVSLPCFTIDLATAAVSFLTSQSSYPDIGCAIHQKAIVYMLHIISYLIVWYISFLILATAVAKTCVLSSGEAAPKIAYWQPVVRSPAVLPSWIPRFKIHFSV